MRATALAFAALCMLWGASGPAVADVGNYEFLSSISPKERASLLATAVRTSQVPSAIMCRGWSSRAWMSMTTAATTPSTARNLVTG